jgi:hypothetical protein
MPRNWSRQTSLWFLRRLSVCSSFFWFSLMIAADSFTLALPLIPPQNGRPGNCSRPSPGIVRHATCYAIATEFMASRSRQPSIRWGFKRCSRLLIPRGKCLLRAPHWLDPKGMSGSFHRLQRAWPAPHSKVLFRILRTIANSFVAGQRCSSNACRPPSGNGPSH